MSSSTCGPLPAAMVSACASASTDSIRASRSTSIPKSANLLSSTSSARGRPVAVAPGRTSRTRRAPRTPARRQWSQAMSSGLSAVGPHDAGSGGTVNTTEPVRSADSRGQTVGVLPGT